MMTTSGTREVFHEAFSSSLLGTMHEYQTKGVLTDFTIIAEGKKFPCHRIVLAAASKYFQAMFKSGLKETEVSEAQLDIIESSTLEIVLGYMYKGTAVLTAKNVEAMYVAADYIYLELLKAECIDFMLDNVTSEMCIPWRRFAQLHDEDELAEKTILYMREQFHEVIDTDGFKNLTVVELKDYIQDDSLHISDENVVVHGVITWLELDRETREKDFDTLFPCLRMSFCTRVFLNAIVGKFPFHGNIKYQVEVYKALANRSIDQEPRKYFRRLIERKSSIVVIGGTVTGYTTNSNYWMGSSIGDLGQGTCDTSSFLDGLNWYSICPIPTGFCMTGGASITGTTRLFYTYHIQNNEWRKMQNLVQERCSHGSVHIDDYIFLFCGTKRKDGKHIGYVRDIECFDMKENNWTTKKSILPVLMRPAVILVGTKALILSGMKDNTGSNQAMIYDCALDKCARISDMPQSALNGSVCVVNNRVFVVASNVCQEYHVEQDTWTVLAPPPAKNIQASVTPYEGCIMMAGGYLTSIENPTKDIYTYNVGNNKWSKKKFKLPVALAGHFMLAINLTQ